MADINAWNSAFPTDVMYNTGVLTHEVAAAQVPIGMTRGGNNFVSGEERRSVEADGLRHRVLGLNRVARWVDTRFEGTLIQLPAALIGKFLPGSATVSVGTPAVATTTPAAAGYVLVVGDMLVKPTLTWARAGTAATFAIQFPLGEIAEWPGMNGKDINETEFAYRILAVRDPSESGYSTNKAPFKIIETAAA